jgi:ketol-acid reductoisomerase
MRDSGLKNIIVGNIEDEFWDTAVQDGFDVYPISKAAELADILFMLIPDEVHGKVYNEDIAKNLAKGDVLNFCHGYSVVFGFVKPPGSVDVIMVAPRMIGKGVRETFVRGTGFPSYIAVEQDSSGNSKKIALAISKAIGSTKFGVFESTFYEEAVIDIFHEQLTSANLYLMKMAYEVLVNAGFNPKLAIMELWASGEAAEEAAAVAEIGLIRSQKVSSKTAQYGMMTRGARLVNEDTRDMLKDILEDIESGKFAREWAMETAVGEVLFKSWWNRMLKDPINKMEETLFDDLKKKRKKWKE